MAGQLRQQPRPRLFPWRGDQQPPVDTLGGGTVAQRGQHPSGQQRGFTGPGRTQHDGQPLPGNLLDHLGDQVVAAEEQVGVLGTETGQPPIWRTVHRVRRGDRTLLGHRDRGRVPPGLPVVVVTATRPGVGQRDVHAWQLSSTRGVRQRRHRIPTARGELPVGHPTGFPAQLPQLDGEGLDDAGRRIHRPFRTRHDPPPRACRTFPTRGDELFESPVVHNVAQPELSYFWTGAVDICLFRYHDRSLSA